MQRLLSLGYTGTRLLSRFSARAIEPGYEATSWIVLLGGAGWELACGGFSFCEPNENFGFVSAVYWARVGTAAEVMYFCFALTHL